VQCLSGLSDLFRRCVDGCGMLPTNVRPEVSVACACGVYTAGWQKKKHKETEGTGVWIASVFQVQFEIMASGKKQTFDEVELSEMVVSPLAVVHGVFVGDAPSVKESRTKNGV